MSFKHLTFVAGQDHSNRINFIELDHLSRKLERAIRKYLIAVVGENTYTVAVPTLEGNEIVGIGPNKVRFSDSQDWTKGYKGIGIENMLNLISDIKDGKIKEETPVPSVLTLLCPETDYLVIVDGEPGAVLLWNDNQNSIEEHWNCLLEEQFHCPYIFNFMVRNKETKRIEILLELKPEIKRGKHLVNIELRPLPIY